METAGLLKHWRDKYWAEDNCARERKFNKTLARPITMTSLTSLFLVTAMGLAFAVLMLLLECLSSAVKLDRKSHSLLKPNHATVNQSASQTLTRREDESSSVGNIFSIDLSRERKNSLR